MFYPKRLYEDVPSFPKTAFPKAFPPWVPQRPSPILRSLSTLPRAGRACTTQGRRIRRQVALRCSGWRAPEGPGSNAEILSAQQNAF
jgi:hypothetical protein